MLDVNGWYRMEIAGTARQGSKGKQEKKKTHNQKQNGWSLARYKLEMTKSIKYRKLNIWEIF